MNDLKSLFFKETEKKPATRDKVNHFSPTDRVSAPNYRRKQVQEKKNDGMNKERRGKKEFNGKQGFEKKDKKYRKEKYDKKEDLLAFMETGNDRDKAAAKRVLSEALQANKGGLVQLIREGGAEIVKVYNAFKGLKLSEQGVIIVGNKRIKEEDTDKHGLQVGDKLLILKVVDRIQAIKQYGDYLSEQVVDKLKMSGSSILRKQNKDKKDGGRGKEVKVVQIGWGISGNDLAGQKKFEIENHLKKGHDVDIIFDDKEQLDKDNYATANSGPSEGSEQWQELQKRRRRELSDVERAVREKVIGKVGEILEGIERLPSTHVDGRRGYLESRTVIHVKGLLKKDENSKKAAKEAKAREKAEKAEKNRMRRLERERLEREQLKELTL